MIFSSPVWFILIIPMVILLVSIRYAALFTRVCVWIVAGLVILAMTNPSVLIPSRKGTVVVVADRSSSMPTSVNSMHKEAVELIQSKMSYGDRLAVVSFGQNAMIDQTPQPGLFGGFVTKVDSNGSDIKAAVELALSVIPQAIPARIILLSDGNWTASDPALAAAAASARNIPIDHRLIERPQGNDVAIDSIDVPSSVSSGQAFMITIWVRSPTTQEVSYKLTRGKSVLATGLRVIPAGVSRMVFRDKAGRPGNFIYKLHLEPKLKDIVSENNSARFCVGIDGPKPILLVNGNTGSKLGELLNAGGVEIINQPVEQCRWAFEHLAKYSAVILEEIPADMIGTGGMENLAAWVNLSGAGLMMTGGKNAFGPGGYFKSPLDPILPVSMELRREHRKLSLAIAVVLDRSGSMAAPVGGGKSKMDLANIATAQVVDLLSSMDELACIAVDSSPHVIVPMSRLSDKSYAKSKIMRIQSMGGGIFVYEGLKAAVRELTKADAATKHIILFADAADSEQPGQYKKLLSKCRKAGITCSVIGLGTKSDCDAKFLGDIAKRGKGRIFFTRDAGSLPRLFAQDTFVVARNSFITESTAVKFSPVMASISGKNFLDVPTIGGYNLCYIKPEALMGCVTVDEYKAPVVAAWRSQLGRVLCYTPQVDGKFTGPIGKWKDIGDFLTSLARWTAGREDKLGDDMMLTQEINEGICKIKLHLDPDRKFTPFDSLPKISILQGTVGEKPDSKITTLKWDSADSLSIDIPVNSGQTVVSTVEVPNRGKVTLSPVCLPYSPEFKPRNSLRGADTLRHLSRMTGGCERMNLSKIWDELPSKPQFFSFAKWLYLFAVIMVLIDVFQRRTGLLSLLKFPLKRIPPPIRRFDLLKSKRVNKETITNHDQNGNQPEFEPEKKQEQDDIFSALTTARSRAKKRHW